MKKNFYILLALFLTRTSFSVAQTHDVSLNLLPIAVANYSLSYMYNFQSEMSVGLVAGRQNLEITDNTLPNSKVSYEGFYLAPEFRYYTKPDLGSDRFFIGGYLKYRNVGTTGQPYLGNLSNGNTVFYDRNNSGLALGGMLGKLWQTKIGLNFSLWTGIGYYLFDTETYTNNYDPSKDPLGSSESINIPDLDVRVGLNFGYRFGLPKR